MSSINTQSPKFSSVSTLTDNIVIDHAGCNDMLVVVVVDILIMRGHLTGRTLPEDMLIVLWLWPAVNARYLC